MCRRAMLTVFLLLTASLSLGTSPAGSPIPCSLRVLPSR